jgi:carbon storage regulator CsrA
MLVLSRRLDEKFLIPSIDATIQVLSIKAGVVRLGIQAPPSVTVLRAELQARQTAAPATAPKSDPHQQHRKHLIDKRLEVARVGMAALERSLRAGRTQEAQVILARLTEDMDMLRQRLASEGEPGAARPLSPCPSIHSALLVEDNANERQLLAYFLRNAGIEVATAGDGHDALDYLHRAPRPDVVLLDMGLPRCDGATMVRTLRKNPAYAGLKIFAVSGHHPDEYGLPTGSDGVDGWFHKPIDPADLLRGVNQELAQSSLSC